MSKPSKKSSPAKPAQKGSAAKGGAPTKVKPKVEGFHPKMHEITVIKSDGEQFKIMTSWGKEGDILKLEYGPENHPAWNPNLTKKVDAKNESVAKFKKKFGETSFL